MAFSDEALAQRLRNLATDRELSGDSVGAKWLYEASARLQELSHIKTSPAWHPSLTRETAATEFEKSYVEIVDWIVKNPFEGEFRGI
jgi:hypothetical protein